MKKNEFLKFKDLTKIKEIYSFLEEETSSFREEVSFSLTFSKTPTVYLEFFTSNTYFRLEKTWFLETYDFFIADFDKKIQESFSSISNEDMDKVIGLLKTVLFQYKKNSFESLIDKEYEKIINNYTYNSNGDFFYG